MMLREVLVDCGQLPQPCSILLIALVHCVCFLHKHVSLVSYVMSTCLFKIKVYIMKYMLLFCFLLNELVLQILLYILINTHIFLRTWAMSLSWGSVSWQIVLIWNSVATHVMFCSGPNYFDIYLNSGLVNAQLASIK